MTLYPAVSVPFSSLLTANVPVPGDICEQGEARPGQSSK
jgi:hypothetical protein